MGVWDDLKERLEVQFASEGDVRMPRPQDLDRFEQESGFRLPLDYREFAATFGPGTYGWGWRVETPDFATAKGSHRGFDPKNPYYPGFVVFCGKEDFHGDFAWDPKDITDPVARDYGVYLLGGPNGDDPDATPIKVASSFREFVLSYAIGGGFERQQAEYGLWVDARNTITSGPVPFFQVLD